MVSNSGISEYPALSITVNDNVINDRNHLTLAVTEFYHLLLSSDSKSGGWGFESLLACQENQVVTGRVL